MGSEMCIRDSISSGQGEALSQAIRAAKRGKSGADLLKAYGKGFGKGFVGNRSGYAKPLRDLGASRGLAGGLGFLADVFADPTTYVAFGAGTASRVALRTAGERAARKALAQGLPKAEVRRRAIAAIREEAALSAERAAVVSRPRGNVSGRMADRAASLRGQGESKAIRGQREQLRKLEKAGRGDSKKAQNLRRNIERAGKKREGRVAAAETKGAVYSARRAAFEKATKGGTKAPTTRRALARVTQPRVVRTELRGSKAAVKSRATRAGVRGAERRGAREKAGTAVTVSVPARGGRRTFKVFDSSLGLRGAKRSNKAVRAGEGLRGMVTPVAPGVRPTSEIAPEAFEAMRRATRVERAGRNAAVNQAQEMDRVIRRNVGELSEADSKLWVAIYERGGRVRKTPDGFVFGPDNALRGVPPKFAKKYVERRSGKFVLRGNARVRRELDKPAEDLRRAGQPVGDALLLRADEGVEAATQYYPRRARPVKGESYAERADFRSIRQENEGVSNRDNLKKRTDPRPLDVGNAERLVDTRKRGDRPELSADLNTDAPSYALRMGREKARADAVRTLASSGKTVRFKPVGDEEMEAFYRRTKLDPDMLATGQGDTVYELAVQGEGAGRYDLRELGPDELSELVTGVTADGRKSALARKGQYVVLDRRVVAEFRNARTSEILNKELPVRLYDRISAGIRRLAISTPMYQAINEMGDTWIMFTVVPAYKIPYYKAKALPVVRYIQAQEAGRTGRRLTKTAMTGDGIKNGSSKDLGNAEIFMADGPRKVRDIASEMEREGAVRQGIYARIVDITNPEQRQLTIGRRGPVRNAAATAAQYSTKAVGRTARSREDWSRTATYLYLRDEGLDSPAAAQKMLNALIDYSELSRTERNVLRRLAFFYTFPARQIPYQAKAFLTRPGKLAAWEKLRVAAAEVQGIDLETIREQPWYVQANVPIPLRVNGEVKWVSAQLPYNMLNQSVPLGTNWPPQNLVVNDFYFGMASLNPLFRAAFEKSTNFNLFFRNEIKSTNEYAANLTPAPSWIVTLVKNVPELRKPFGLQRGYTSYEPNKKIWLMDVMAAWGLSQLSFGPVRPLAEIGKVRNQRGMTQAESLFKFVTGIRLDSDKSTQEKLNQLYEKKKVYNQTQARLRKAKQKDTPIYERNKARIKVLQDAIDALRIEQGEQIETPGAGGSGNWLDNLSGRGSSGSTGGGSSTSGSWLDNLD